MLASDLAGILFARAEPWLLALAEPVSEATGITITIGVGIAAAVGIAGGAVAWATLGHRITTLTKLGEANTASLGEQAKRADELDDKRQEELRTWQREQFQPLQQLANQTKTIMNERLPGPRTRSHEKSHGV